MPIPPRMTVEGGFGGADAGFTAGAGEVLAAFFASAGVAVTIVVAPPFVSAGFAAGTGEALVVFLASAGGAVAVVVAPPLASAGLLDVGGVAAVASLVSIGGADFFLPPNIGDQAKPMRGAKLKLLSMLFWF